MPGPGRRRWAAAAGRAKGGWPPRAGQPPPRHVPMLVPAAVTRPALDGGAVAVIGAGHVQAAAVELDSAVTGPRLLARVCWPASTGPRPAPRGWRAAAEPFWIAAKRRHITQEVRPAARFARICRTGRVICRRLSVKTASGWGAPAPEPPARSNWLPRAPADPGAAAFPNRQVLEPAVARAAGLLSERTYQPARRAWGSRSCARAAGPGGIPRLRTSRWRPRRRDPAAAREPLGRPRRRAGVPL